ncbi:hypothetical protein Scep_007902 [Stephania cephalantha]|uniref:SWIM-type domain-containing protein n=1 Tax=Stephania cephalantha TaxID=152367 RepID=A0AAP0KDE1_9MAGN
MPLIARANRELATLRSFLNPVRNVVAFSIATNPLLKGSSFQTAVKLLSLSVSYGGKQHVPLSLIKSHAKKAMEVILKSYVDRAAVQCSCDELNGETTVCLHAFMHIKQKGDPSDNQFSEPVFLHRDLFLNVLVTYLLRL